MNKKMRKRILPLTLSATFLLSGLPGTYVPAALQSICGINSARAAEAQTWDFSNGLGSWHYGGIWDYSGTPELSYDAIIGNGAAKLTVDFTKNAKTSWSEIKLENGALPFALEGYNVVTYDFYFNPKSMSSGTFKTKLYMTSDKNQEVVNAYPDIALDSAEPVEGTDLKKVKVHIPFSPANVNIAYFMISIVGNNTDYKGDVYIDNITLGHEVVKDVYVDCTASLADKNKVDMNNLTIPSIVSPTDAKADANTVKLLAYLQGIAQSDKKLYGHQNDMHKKVGRGVGPSDTYELTGDYPAVVGIDGLALTGSELDLTGAEKAKGLTLIDKAANIGIEANRVGAIVTMSCHMPNFADVAAKGKKDGKNDYSGYTPTVTSGDVVARILPGGDLNSVYTGYLDMLAEYGQKLQAQGVPVLFRPFHENNGSWFWWGAAFCSPSQYKNLFRYTEEYLRDKKGLHNFLYVYSPGGPFTSEEDYLTRYPGDAFIDIIGFDMYHKDPAVQDTWMDSFGSTMDLVQQFAQHHNKVAAVTETGILVGNSAMAKSGNKRPDWFNEALEIVKKHKMAYFMTWSNFDETNFDQPYMISDKRGHEMINNFVDFYNKPEAVFAGQMGDYRTLNIKKQVAASTYGYITSPNSNDRICEPAKLKANVAGKVQNAHFVIKKADGTAVATIDAKGNAGVYSADLTKAKLDALGKTVGMVELQLDGNTVDSLKVLYNMPQPKLDPSLVDDFENYYGDNGMLQSVYSTNIGAGCSVTAVLAEEAKKHNGGDTGLNFHYKIVKNGYAGVIKSLKGANWSQYDAIQFWAVPDGKGQRLIIQLNSNGEDFEVDLANFAKETSPRLVTIPFSQFKGKQNGKFDKENVQHFAIYCNATGDEKVDSNIYFDDIKAVKQ